MFKGKNAADGKVSGDCLPIQAPDAIDFRSLGRVLNQKRRIQIRVTSDPTRLKLFGFLPPALLPRPLRSHSLQFLSHPIADTPIDPPSFTQPDAATLQKKLKQKQEELDMLQTANEALQAQSRMSNERADAMENMAGDKEMALSETKKALDAVSNKLTEAETIAKDAAVVVETAAESEAKANDKASALESKLSDTTEELSTLRATYEQTVNGIQSELSETQKKAKANADRVVELETNLERTIADAAAANAASLKLVTDLEEFKSENAKLVKELNEERGETGTSTGKKGSKASQKTMAKDLEKARAESKKLKLELSATEKLVNSLHSEKNELVEMYDLAKQQVTLIQEAEEKAVVVSESLRKEVDALSEELRAARGEIAKTIEDAKKAKKSPLITSDSASKLSEKTEQSSFEIEEQSEKVQILESELETLKDQLKECETRESSTREKLNKSVKRATDALAELSSAKNYCKKLETEKAGVQAERDDAVAEAKRATVHANSALESIKKQEADHKTHVEELEASARQNLENELADLRATKSNDASSNSHALQQAVDRAAEAEKASEAASKCAETIQRALDETNAAVVFATANAAEVNASAAESIDKAREAQKAAEQEAQAARDSEERARQLSLKRAEEEDVRDSKAADLEARLAEAVQQAAAARGDASAAREGEAEALLLAKNVEEDAMRAREEARVSKAAATAAAAQAETSEEARNRMEKRYEEAETKAQVATAAAAAATETTATTRIELESALEAAESRAAEAEEAEAHARAAAAAVQAGVQAKGDGEDLESTPRSLPLRGTPSESPHLVDSHVVADLTAKTAAAIASRNAERVNFEKRFEAAQAATRRAESGLSSAAQRCTRLEEQLTVAEQGASSSAVAAERAASNAEEARARAAATTTALDAARAELTRFEEKCAVAEQKMHSRKLTVANLEDELAREKAETARERSSKKLLEQKFERDIVSLSEEIEGLKHRLEAESDSNEKRLHTIHGQNTEDKNSLSSVKEELVECQLQLKNLRSRFEDEKVGLNSEIETANGRVAELERSSRRMEESLSESRAETAAVKRAQERANDASSDQQHESSKIIGKLRAEIASLKSQIEGWGDTRRGFEDAARKADAEAIAAVAKASAADAACAEAKRARDLAVEDAKDARKDTSLAAERSNALALELKQAHKATYEASKAEQEARDALIRLDQGERAAESVRKESEATASNYTGTEIEALRRRLQEAHLSVSRAAEDASRSASALEEAEARRHAAQSETARLAGERRVATARATTLEHELAEKDKSIKSLERALAEGGIVNGQLEKKLADATEHRQDAERRFEETRDALRAARGDAASASAASAEMERRMAAAQRSAAEATMRLKVGSASRELVAARLRDAEAEVAKRAAEGLSVAETSRDFASEMSQLLQEAKEAQVLAETMATQAKESAQKARLELVQVSESRAVALGQAADAEQTIARLASRCERLTKRLYPNGGRPDFQTEFADDENGLNPQVSSDELIVLRATLQGHPIGHDLDVTASLRRRLKSHGDKRLIISIAENLKDELFCDEFPRVDNYVLEGDKTFTSEGRLVVEYAASGKYYGNDENDVNGTPTKRGGLTSVTLPIGGIDTNEPFPVNSLLIDASPLAADAAVKDASIRLRDAERVAAQCRSRLVLVEHKVTELTDETFSTRKRCNVAERRVAALTETARAASFETSIKSKELKRVEQEAVRAIDIAELARERARQAVNSARDEAERSVQKAVRDERLRFEQKAREVRLAGAAERRRRIGTGNESSILGNRNRSTPVGATPSGPSSKKGTWGVPKSTPTQLKQRNDIFDDETLSSTFDASSFLRNSEMIVKGEMTGELTAGQNDSPIDAQYKFGKKASQAATMEAQAWAAARAAAAKEVADEVTAARRRIQSIRSKPVADELLELVEDSRSATLEHEEVPVDDDENFEIPQLPEPTRHEPSAADEARRRAEVRVRSFQKREQANMERRNAREYSAPSTPAISKSKPLDPPMFTPEERRAAFVHRSAVEKLKQTEEALFESKRENYELMTREKRAQDADAFDAELASVRRRAAAEILRNREFLDPENRDVEDAKTLAASLIAQSEETLER